MRRLKRKYRRARRHTMVMSWLQRLFELRPRFGIPAKKILSWAFCIVVISTFVLVFRAYLRKSDQFAVKWVQVEGADELRPDEISRQSAITTADNLLFLDTEAAMRRVESAPYVRSCRLERVFPDKVILAVEERKPVATLLENNHMFEMDREGVLLKELAAGEPHCGPLITNVPDLTAVEAGMCLDNAVVQSALSVWDAFSRVSMAEHVTVSELAAFDVSEIVMYCDQVPCEIRWGRGDFEKQAQRLDILWRELDGAFGCKEYLDLRFGADLVCK